ncbi:MAG: hypothetical protein U0P30_03965 [Vicinamibacterales bacterium]
MKVVLPVKPVVGVKVKLPSALSDATPFTLFASSTAVMAPPPLALSLASTPGAFTVSVVLNAVE